MKTRLFYWILMVAAISFAACSDDEKPKTIPVVITGTFTDITTKSVNVSGEIADDGNAEVTFTGFVYSSIVAVPTIADDKIELTDVDGDFIAKLEGLNSATTYHVRAYATNSKGTGYGEVVDFTTGNEGPIATAVSITGTIQANMEVTATYTYSDEENDVEGGTTIQWYKADNAAGTGQIAIAGATSATYTIQNEEQGKFIRVGVTPQAKTGTTQGIEAVSTLAGPVGEATTVTFLYNGAEVTYGIIVSSVTQRRWMDRNLGALNVPTSFTDFANYGDLFQWGRLADGHQLVIRGATNAETTGVNGVTPTTSASDDPQTLLFIAAAGLVDWHSPSKDNLWQGVSGINNPCPEKWRLPTKDEWTAENITNVDNGYTKLKITRSGQRKASDGLFASTTSRAAYWSSTPYDGLAGTTVSFWFTAASSSQTYDTRATGNACRCIKD